MLTANESEPIDCDYVLNILKIRIKTENLKHICSRVGG
jgi:hypothetical protein